MINLEVHIVSDETIDNKYRFCASLHNADEIIAGYGSDPYEALREMVNEMQFQHEYFRADEE